METPNTATSSAVDTYDKGNTIEVIYGVKEDELVFIPRSTAEESARLWHAFETSATWRDFRKAVGTDLYNQVIDRIVQLDDPERKPRLSDPFDANAIPGYADGDWPTWHEQHALHWMPETVVARYGERDISIISGPFVVFHPDDEDAIVVELTAHGYKCVEDVKLVHSAYGWSVE